MASSQLPSIVQVAQRTQREVDLAVRRFRKDDRYDQGARIRACVTEVRRLGYRAWNSPERRAQLLQDLVDAVDDLKLELQLARESHAFPSAAEFDAIWRSVESLGTQAGAWRNSVHPKGQNPAPPQAQQERARKLSTRAASCEAQG